MGKCATCAELFCRTQSKWNTTSVLFSPKTSLTYKTSSWNDRPLILVDNNIFGRVFLKFQFHWKSTFIYLLYCLQTGNKLWYLSNQEGDLGHINVHQRSNVHSKFITHALLLACQFRQVIGRIYTVTVLLIKIALLINVRLKRHKLIWKMM